MRVKELIERLQSFDKELDVYLYNEEEPALYLADSVNKTSDWGDEDGWEDFITIFPSTDNKPLFTLTAEEVEFMQEALEEAKFLYLQEIKKWEGRRNMLEHKECIEKWDNLLNRIKKWKDENNRTN